MSGSTVVAAFDVDGTLTVRDCVRPFLERLAGRRGLVFAAARRPITTVTAAARRDRDELKDVIVGGVFGGRRVADVEAEGRSFASLVNTRFLRPDMMERVRWHQRMGHRTVMVSASLRPYLVPLASALGMASPLCTDVEHDGERRHLDVHREGERHRPDRCDRGARTARSWSPSAGRGGTTPPNPIRRNRSHAPTSRGPRAAPRRRCSCCANCTRRGPSPGRGA